MEYAATIRSSINDTLALLRVFSVFDLAEFVNMYMTVRVALHIYHVVSVRPKPWKSSSSSVIF